MLNNATTTNNVFKLNLEYIKTSDIKKELKMSYIEYVNYLLQKYGSAKYDYFRTPSCSSRNPNISRTDEGLFCHHIDEDKAILLSNPEIARNYPFEYQKANRLVYCDIVEHLILHIKIAEEREICFSDIGIGGTSLITENINKYISNPYSSNWEKTVIKVLEQKYNEYIYVLGYLRNLLTTDVYYAYNPLFSDCFLCFDGKNFVKSVYNDLKTMLDWDNYKDIIKNYNWSNKELNNKFNIINI